MVRLPPITTEQRNRFIKALLDIGTRRVDREALVELQNLLSLAPNIDDGCDLDGTDEFIPGKGHTMSVGGKPHTTPHPNDTMPQELGMHGPLADKLPAPNPQDAGLIVTPEDMKPPTAPK